jgi:hypothetical protein
MKRGPPDELVARLYGCRHMFDVVSCRPRGFTQNRRLDKRRTLG